MQNRLRDYAVGASIAIAVCSVVLLVFVFGERRSPSDAGLFEKNAVMEFTLNEVLDDVDSVKMQKNTDKLYQSFEELSAFHSPATSEFVFAWKKCRLLRVNVRYVGVKGDKWQGKPDRNWRIESVSAPYVEQLPVD